VAGTLFSNGSKPAVVDLRAFMDTSIPELVAELVQMGVLVSVGTTRDRGAVSLTITSDGAYDREYFRDPVDAADYLRRAAKALGGPGLGESETQAPAVQTPTRRRQKLT